jgi:hypothetical protein
MKTQIVLALLLSSFGLFAGKKYKNLSIEVGAINLRNGEYVCGKENFHLIVNLIEQHIQRALPELDEKKRFIELTETGNSNYFFSVIPKPLPFLRKVRGIKIRVNCSVFASENKLPLVALDAILGHELIHALDYISIRALKFYSLVGAIAFSMKKRRRYERDTDIILLGRYSSTDSFDRIKEGLIQYRYWVYKKMKTPKKLRTKKLMYLTPEDIRSFQIEHFKQGYPIYPFKFRKYLL